MTVTDENDKFSTNVFPASVMFIFQGFHSRAIFKSSLSEVCRQLTPTLTALLAILDPIALELGGTDPLWSSPLQCDGSVADVVNVQSDGLACRG